MTQLSLFEDDALFNDYGFTIEKPFNFSSNNKFEKLESTQKISYEGKTILYLQSNDDGTFNTFSFNEFKINITLDEAIKIAQEIVRRTNQ